MKRQLQARTNQQITLKTAIETFGRTDLNPILALVKNFDDLLVFGKAFLTNQLYRSVSYLGEFGKESDTCGHDQERDRLLECHTLRCFTINGQISSKYKDSQGCLTLQRSYISFFCEKSTAEHLLPQLKSREDLYFTMLSHEIEERNFTEDKINMTKYQTVEKWVFYTNMWRKWTYKDICEDEFTRKTASGDKCYKDYNAIFDKLVFVEFVMKEYNGSKESAEVLLEMLR
jgi:hypothetical protein